MIPELTNDTFERAVTSTDLPVLVFFTSPTCAHCHRMEPYVEGLAAQTQGRAVVVKVNAMANAKTARAVGAMQLPTFLLLHRGEEFARYQGDRFPATVLGQALASRIGQ